MKFRRIIFDFDGTLIFHDKLTEARQIANFLKIEESQINEFERRLDSFFCSNVTKKIFSCKKITKELYLQTIDYVMGPLSDFGISKEEVSHAIDKKAKYYSFLLDGVKETLEYLKEKGYELCILTNGFYNLQYDILKFKGISEYFERIYAWDDFYAKPDKRAFYRAMEGKEAHRIVMIGDDLLTDIKPAKEIGMYTIGYRLRTNEKIKIKPDKVITDFKELMNIL